MKFPAVDSDVTGSMDTIRDLLCEVAQNSGMGTVSCVEDEFVSCEDCMLSRNTDGSIEAGITLLLEMIGETDND